MGAQAVGESLVCSIPPRFLLDAMPNVMCHKCGATAQNMDRDQLRKEMNKIKNHYDPAEIAKGSGDVAQTIFTLGIKKGSNRSAHRPGPLKHNQCGGGSCTGVVWVHQSAKTPPGYEKDIPQTIPGWVQPFIGSPPATSFKFPEC